MSDTSGYEGALGLFDAQDEFAELWFVITRLINRRCTASLVQVKAVNGGDLAGPPTVDVQPMVHQIDGQGGVQEHGTLYSVPVFRLQRGATAIIIDPAVGDVGLAVFASHDSSVALKTKTPSPPGSRRRFDWADGFYLGGFAGEAVTRYIRLADSGISIVDSTLVTVEAPQVIVNAATKAVVNSPEVDLGGTGGAGVARIGDTVAGGVITGGSSKVKAT